MTWITPITDRTQEDIEILKKYELIGYNNLSESQKEIWRLGMRGALNATDLNRIEINTQYLANLLDVNGLEIKRNWEIKDICLDADFNRILGNIDILKDQFCLDFEYEILLPETPDIPINDYEKLNQVEYILDVMHDYLVKVLNWSILSTSDTRDFATCDGEEFMVVN